MRSLLLLFMVSLGATACSPGEVTSLNVPAESSLSFGQLPDVQLLDATGQAVSPARLRGSAWILVLLSRQVRQPSRSMKMTLSGISTAIAGTDARLVSLSVDPLGDSPEELAAYGEKVGADGDTWMLWTGSEVAVYQVVQAAYRGALVGIGQEVAQANEAATLAKRALLAEESEEARGALVFEASKAARTAKAAAAKDFQPRAVVIDSQGRVRGAYNLGVEDGVQAALERLRFVAKEL